MNILGEQYGLVHQPYLRGFFDIMLGLGLAMAVLAQANQPVAIVCEASATVAEQQAARELAEYLGKIYPLNRFTVGDRLPETGFGILVGNVKANPLLRRYLGEKAPALPESYMVTIQTDGPRKLGIIAGADARATVYGVYALLNQLGCGFYLSYDALPPASRESFSFNGWALADAPVVSRRLVFNWHNFLSGCSTWNAKEWKHWTLQAQKMGYNAIMVHAYGNNPMVSFSFNGRQKPLGYLSTTRKGRDWSTMHVNDVRRLWGGFVFETPVFGAEAAQAPDDQRGPAAQRLMREVFDHARQRQMDVFLAVDVDTISANPQDLILTLPASARFSIKVQGMQWMGQEPGRMWLANPDTPEGYDYYRTQVAALLAAYPSVNHLVVWFRTVGTPWIAFPVEEMPTAWQEQFRSETAKTPEAAKLWHAHNMFAVGKIVSAFDRALKELHHPEVQLATGSWGFDYLNSVHRFFPAGVAILPLDYNVLHDQSQLDTIDRRKAIAAVGRTRPVIPVAWAHHDDGNYVGRPYTPFPNFAEKLTESGAAGFGIIHWTTRPLDLYFSSLARQVWQSQKNEPLRQTCEEMAARTFGASARTIGGQYLEQWITTAPKIARETSDLFVDKKLPDVTALQPAYTARTELLNSILRGELEPGNRQWVNYFLGLEQYVMDIHATEAALQTSRAHLKAGDLAAARQAFAACRPEAVIERYARFASLGGINRGEQGLVVSMNLRWLSHYIRHRQLLGVDTVRYRFAPTSHDPLAQSPGTFTFHVDAQTNFWECLGQKETGLKIFQVPEDAVVTLPTDVPPALAEICRSGIESDEVITCTVQPIMAKGGRGRAAGGVLPAGKYLLHLYFLDPTATASGQRVFEVSVNQAIELVDVFKLAGRAQGIVRKSYPVQLANPGLVEVRLKPVNGKAILNGLVLEPQN